MRNTLIVAAVILVSMTTLMGCTKSATTTAYSMSASYSGAGESFNNCYVSMAYNPFGGSSYYIEGLQNMSDFPYIVISLPAILPDTTFAISSTNNATYCKDTLTTKRSISGSITIVSVTPNVTGTFSFTCTDGTVISGGTFTAKPFTNP